MKGKKSWFQKKNICLFALLLLFWLILSPRISIEAVVVGGIVSTLVVLYSQELVFEEKEMTLYSLKKLKSFIIFIGYLLIEIVKANIDVALIVLNPSLPIQPCFISVPMMLKNDVNKVIYSNAVTLTPGTLTVDIKEDEFIIHALTTSAAEGMVDSIIEQHCCRLEEDVE